MAKKKRGFGRIFGAITGSPYERLLKQVDKVVDEAGSDRALAKTLRKLVKTVSQQYEEGNIDEEEHDLVIEAIEEVICQKSKGDILISTTGKTSRELYVVQNKLGLSHNDLFVVGGMGHAASLTLGVSLKSNKQNICLDGDGSLLMHAGSLGVVTKFGGKKFKYILLRNDSHESVGNQTTNSEHINYKMLSKSFGFRTYSLITNEFNLKNVLKNFIKKSGPAFLEVRIKSGSINQLGRPKNLKIVKNKFMSK